MAQRHEDIEAALVGALIGRPKSVEAVISVLEPEVFLVQDHGVAYRAMVDLYMANEPADLVHLCEALPDLSSFLAGLPTDLAEHNILPYANLVVKNSRRRLLSKTLRAAAELAEAGGQPSDVVGMVDAVITDKDTGASQDYFTTSDLTKIVLTDMARAKQDPKSRQVVPTGYAALDDIMSGGFRPGDLVIVAGRPAMGKTALAINFAINTAKAGTPSLVFSLEMTAVSLQMRMAQVLCGLRRHELDPYHLTEGGLEKTVRALDRVAALPILINDKSAISTPLMHRVISRAVRKHSIKMIFVDYLQLVRGPSQGDMREREIAEISGALKRFAKEFNVTVVAASQLNRQVEARDSKVPMMSDLRESGAIEQDADIVLLLYRDDYYNPNPDSKTGLTDLIVGKHRNGPTGIVPLAFEDSLTRFVSFTGSDNRRPEDDSTYEPY